MNKIYIIKHFKLGIKNTKIIVLFKELRNETINIRTCVYKI